MAAFSYENWPCKNINFITFALIASESLDTQGFQIGAVATHPRKGTETPCIIWPARMAFRCNSPPQGDGNLKFLAIAAYQLRCNSPPQGDGNIWIRHLPFSLKPCCNSPPQGDGNLLPLQTYEQFLEVATHPRKGTETNNSIMYSSLCLCCNSPPQGDGNLFEPIVYCSYC